MTAVSSQPVRGSRFPTLEKYDVLEELGHGGMATVYRAKDLRLGRDVALKVIHPHLRDSAEAVRRFSIEARAVAKLRHRNIVEVYDVSGPTEPEQYLVVELLRGVTLRKLLEKHGAIPPEIAAAIGVELLGALGHAHEEGVIHRDVKPENVILEHHAAPASSEAPEASEPSARTTPQVSSAPGDRMVIKLTDFGIAKLLDAQGVTSTGQVLGSPAHMAPEQIEGRDVDARADVFALGVLLYECMVGHLPFMGTNPAQVLRRVLDGEYPSAERELATVGKTWSHLLDRALASNVADRYANAGEMRDALTGELARMGVAAPRAEIERWLDDPERFVLEHKTAMTTRLCDRAAEAQKRGDVLTAASDYNRALAYSPDDPALLKLVLRVNRRRARAEVVRRMLPLGSVAILLAVGGLAVARALLSRTPPPPVTPDTDALGAVTKPVVVLPPPAVVPSDLLSEAPSATRVLARPTVSSGRAAPPPPPHETSREVRFSSVVPAEGVSLSIDGAPPTPLDVQKPLTLDEKRHALTFTCRFDLCDPLVRAVDPGDRPATLLPVHLTIKPGFLKVIGQPGMHYFLDGDPAHPLNANGEANLVAMTQSAVRFVRVKELETQQTRTIDVRAKQTAGPLDFNQPP